MRRWLTAAALSLGIAAGAVPAAHAAAPAADSDTPTQSSSSFFGTQSCPQQPVQQPLVDVGDAGWYYLVQNGSFTEGTNAWSTSSAVLPIARRARLDARGAHHLDQQPLASQLLHDDLSARRVHPRVEALPHDGRARLDRLDRREQTSITVQAYGGTFLVDDVMVDPWRYNTP